MIHLANPTQGIDSHLHLVVPGSIEYTNLSDISPFIQLTHTLSRRLCQFTKCVKQPQLVGKHFMLGAMNRQPYAYLLQVETPSTKSSFAAWELGNDYSFICIPTDKVVPSLVAIWGS